jgi:hypothetical protein
MKIQKLLALITLILLLGGTLSAFAQKIKKPKKPKPTKTNQQTSTTTTKTKEPMKTEGNDAFKILVNENQSGVEKPFVFVARDVNAYKELTKLVSQLPAISEIDFSTNAVVSVFLGTKPTPGYTVIFTKTDKGAKLITSAPPKDLILPQVLTSPVKIALIPQDEESSLQLEISDDLKKSAKTYHVKSGEFQFTGGFAPIERKFQIGGTIDVWQVNNLVTLDFNLKNSNDETPRMLEEMASGSTAKENISIWRVDSGSFIDPPRPALKADGTFSPNKLTLTFESLKSIYSDGYEGSGKLIATP